LAERGALPARTRAVLDFADRLVTDYTTLDLASFAALERHFSRPDLVGIVAFAAWQFGGPRMLRSWRAEDYKRGERPELDTLPVRLAYSDSDKDAPGRAYLPPLPGQSADTILARAEAGGSPPVEWLRFLAPHPRLLEAWSSFYWTVFDAGVLPPRLKHLARLRMAQVLDCPEWVPEDAPRLRELGIGPRERTAVEWYDTSVLSPEEVAALAYAETLAYGGPVEDDVFAPLALHCSEAELVELGFAVASQSGVIRVYHWLSRIGVLSAVGGRRSAVRSRP
jgi:alkylhydroperoxidase family enzyme